MGIYSLMAFLTAQRTQEIGVRMALGAGRWQVIRATTHARDRASRAIGSLVGAALALGLGRVMQSMLLRPGHDERRASSSGWSCCWPSAALLAAYLPARRAARIDPMAALSAAEARASVIVSAEVSPWPNSFIQTYSPVAGSILLSALVASIPPLLLALMLACWRFAPWKSAIAGATSAVRCSRGWSGACRSA